jgi:hypothetical protein
LMPKITLGISLILSKEIQFQSFERRAIRSVVSCTALKGAFSALMLASLCITRPRSARLINCDFLKSKPTTRPFDEVFIGRKCAPSRGSVILAPPDG